MKQVVSCNHNIRLSSNNMGVNNDINILVSLF